MPQFTGFPAATFEFLDELERNNNRDWFGANKARYEAGVREPALDFITTMGPELAKISEHFVALPKKVGGSLMRVYRDTRFSKDKTPYKTNIGIQFRHERGKDVHAPGYYLHIDNETCFLGVGLWRPDAEGLAGIRQRIVERPNDWKKARDARAFKSAFELGGGESLKRPPRGFSEDSPHMEDLKRKDFIAVVNFAAKDTESRDFVKQVASTFRKATPFMTFLCAAVGVEF
jgi:uncharacterized protein (TIGR02453 family)